MAINTACGHTIIPAHINVRTSATPFTTLTSSTLIPFIALMSSMPKKREQRQHQDPHPCAEIADVDGHQQLQEIAGPNAMKSREPFLCRPRFSTEPIL